MMNNIYNTVLRVVFLKVYQLLGRLNREIITLCSETASKGSSLASNIVHNTIFSSSCTAIVAGGWNSLRQSSMLDRSSGTFSMDMSLIS